MIHKSSTRRRWAALTSGAVVTAGLVVAPAVAGLSAATAAPVALAYTCSGSAAGQNFSLPATVTVEVTTPSSLPPGADFSAAITAKLDMGSANFGPVSSLTGKTDFPVALGDSPATFTTKSITAPMTALVFADSGSVPMTAPAAVGDTPITLGTIVGHLTADPYGIALLSTCVPTAGQDLTIGHVTVSEDAPPPPPVDVPVDVPVTGKVAVDGKAKVGKKLTAKPGQADGADIGYQWLSNGKNIKKATGKSLKLDKSLKGKKVSVKVTYTESGYTTVVQTSKAVKVKK